ncbi:MAG TPA: hypothetical protein VNM89_02970 [Solirubrobacterales bacterium]|nr:hypothetical protein [Solirubrobacterales bacterium]
MLLPRSIQKTPVAIFAIGLLFALAPSSALAAPTATTETATEVAATTATLNATISAEGHRTDYLFGYGTSPDISEMTSATPKETTSSGSPVVVSARLSGLGLGTTYYFAIATHDLVTDKYIVGEVRSFATLSADNGMQFMAAEYPATIGGSLGLERVFEAGGGLFTVDCRTRNLSGSFPEASASLTLTPELKSCGGSFGVITVKMNSCHYVFDVNRNYGVYAGGFAVSCDKEGDTIDYASSVGCTVKVPAQSIPRTSGIQYQNTGPLNARVISAQGWAWNLRWTTGGTRICQLGGLSASGEDGSMASFNGTTLKATNEEDAQTEFYVAG